MQVINETDTFSTITDSPKAYRMESTSEGYLTARYHETQSL